MTAIELQQVQNKGEGEEGIVQFMFNRLSVDKNAEIICDNNRPTKIAILRRMGYSNAKPATKGQGSIEDGIDILSNMDVYYTSDSENLEYEQENYSRKVDRYGIILEEPEDVDNHLIDPTRYIAQRLVEKGIIKAI
jgi:phage terminase large subunit